VPIDTKNVHTKLEVRSFTIPEIIEGTEKILAVHAAISPEFLRSFCLHGPCEYTRQI